MPENKNENEPINKQNTQNELENLSWRFILEREKIIRLEEERLSRERLHLRQIKEKFEQKKEKISNYNEYPDEIFDPYHDQKIIKEQELAQWYSQADDSQHPNDLGRASGIIFDEEKLKKQRITAWKKAPRLRPNTWQKIIGSIKYFFRAFFSSLFGKSIHFFLFVARKAAVFSHYSLAFSKFIFSLPWQILLAMRSSFVYLFAGFGQLFKKEYLFRQTALSQVDASEEYREPGINDYQGFFTNIKPAFIFSLFFCLLAIPAGIYAVHGYLNQKKGEVLGASKAGVAYLAEAKQAGLSFDWQTARRKIALAENEFSKAEGQFTRLGILASGLSLISEDAQTGEKLIRVVSLSAEVGEHLLKIVSGWKKENINDFFMALDVSSDGGQGKEKKQGTTAVATHTLDWPAMIFEIKQAFIKTQKIESELSDLDLNHPEISPYRDQIVKLKNELPTIQQTLKDSQSFLEILSYLLGSEEPRTIMLVFQNNSELRPTGGFLGSYAILKTKMGKITSVNVPGGGFYDLKGSLAVSVDPPYPFHLFSPVFQIWNANWFPDWRISAEKIAWFYQKSGGETIDAIVSFTPEVLEEILTVTGEIAMPEYQTAVNSQNFVRMAQTEVELEYDKEINQPKKFIGDLLFQMLSLLPDFNYDQSIALWHILSQELAEKNILFYARDTLIQSKASLLGWTGEIVNTDKDYLAVIHTNVAGGKTDRVIKTNIFHQADLMADGRIINTVALTKEHKGRPDDFFEGQKNIDFVRFYVPLGSRLLSATGFDERPIERQWQKAENIAPDPDISRLETNERFDPSSGTRITDELEKTVFGNWIVLFPGEIKTVTIKYILPFQLEKNVNIAASTIKAAGDSPFELLKKYFFDSHYQPASRTKAGIYTFYLQKQAGNNEQNFRSIFTVKNNNWIIDSYLAEKELSANEKKIETAGDLKNDHYYGLLLY